MAAKVHEPTMELDADAITRVLRDVLTGKRKGTPELLALVRQSQSRQIGKRRKLEAETSAPLVAEPAQAAPADAEPRKRRHYKAALNVKLVRMKRQSGDYWVARWNDPVTGASKQESLSRLGLKDEDDCRTWVADKARTLAEQRAAVAAGVAVVTKTPVADAVKLFYESQANELKASTLRVYRESTRPFVAWAFKHLPIIEGVQGKSLTAFRDYFMALGWHGYAKGKGTPKGARVESKHKRSAGQQNKIIRALRTVLNFWRLRGLTPHLSSDTIRDSLKFRKAPKPAPVFMRQGEIRKLLEAAKRHDENLGHDATGREHSPIFDFVAGALLSGMRFGEIANLKWEHVDLDAGEIRLPHTATKTGHARTIGLRESPALAALLARRKLASGGNPWVFGLSETDSKGKAKFSEMRRDVAEGARKRLRKWFASGKFQWHLLRKTCGTFLTCAPAIYGGASSFLSAKRLGHSVDVSEKHYAGNINNIDATATTLEAAMGVADLLPAPVALVKSKVRQA